MTVPSSHRFARAVAALMLMATLAACSRSGPPAPVVEHSGSVSRPPSPIAAAPAQATVVGGGSATVNAGDTLYSIARRHHVPIRAVIDANRLEPPYNVRPGQQLVLPRVRTHTVGAGDTIYGLSRRYGVERAGLVQANGLAPPYNIQIGQVLILPDAPGAAPTETIAAATPSVARTPQPAPVAPSPTVSSSPTASSPSADRPIAGVDSATLPPPTGPTGARPVQPEPLPAPEPPAAAVTPANPPTEVAAVSPAAEPPAIELPARGGRGFAWPVRGSVVSNFGPKPGGLHNDGINIAVPRGTPIRAAESGVVAYAGNELRGFGNLILIRHADGWVTAYAHADDVLVQRGEQVRRGQVIGRVGNTGNVTSPQLHFELRRGTRPVDPREHLGPLTASAS